MEIIAFFENLRTPETSQGKYLYPIDTPNPEKISTENDLRSHYGPYVGAIDFIVPVGTNVIAIDDGVVVDQTDGNNQYGNHKKFANFANYITIRHENGEYSQYLHLKNLKVQKGDQVVQGQNIAQTGLNGFMDKPHLHFFVFKKSNNKHGFIGLKPNFLKPTTI